jgi:hypothetical protein
VGNSCRGSLRLYQGIVAQRRGTSPNWPPNMRAFRGPPSPCVWGLSGAVAKFCSASCWFQFRAPRATATAATLARGASLAARSAEQINRTCAGVHIACIRRQGRFCGTTSRHDERGRNVFSGEVQCRLMAQGGHSVATTSHFDPRWTLRWSSRARARLLIGFLSRPPCSTVPREPFRVRQRWSPTDGAAVGWTTRHVTPAGKASDGGGHHDQGI